MKIDKNDAIKWKCHKTQGIAGVKIDECHGSNININFDFFCKYRLLMHPPYEFLHNHGCCKTDCTLIFTTFTWPLQLFNSSTVLFPVSKHSGREMCLPWRFLTALVMHQNVSSHSCHWQLFFAVSTEVHHQSLLHPEHL